MNLSYFSKNYGETILAKLKLQKEEINRQSLSKKVFASAEKLASEGMGYFR